MSFGFVTIPSPRIASVLMSRPFAFVAASSRPTKTSATAPISGRDSSRETGRTAFPLVNTKFFTHVIARIKG